MTVASTIALLLVLGAGALLTLAGTVHAVVGSPAGMRLSVVGPAASIGIAAIGFWLFVTAALALVAMVPA